MGEEQVLYFEKPKYARLDIEGVPFFQGNVGTQSSNMAFQIVNGKPK
jgi:flagellar motor switch protein FliM